MPSGGLNLSSVDEAFGEKADLYHDVLRIKSDATTNQVQQAYFNRRDQLFQILAKMDQIGVPSESPRRYNVERQMDAVVMALRVLGDADTRLKYDFMRADRISGRNAISPRVSLDEEDIPLGTRTSISYSDMSNSPSGLRLKSALKTSKDSDDGHRRSMRTGELTIDVNNSGSADDYESDSRDGTPESIHKVMSRDEMSRVSRVSKVSRKSSSSRGSAASKGRSTSAKRKTRKVIRPRNEMVRAKTVRRSDDDDTSQVSVESTPQKRSMFERVKEELMGVVEDTTRSFEQVFGAFTLQEEEILAVFGRIDKAKEQMEHQLSAY